MRSQQTGASNSASLRPRNRRLVSIEDDLNSGSRNVSPARSDADTSDASFSSARPSSPLPSAHPSRTTSRQRSAQRNQSSSKTWGFQTPSTITSNPLFTPGYWETSWSSIQGIASTLLGSDASSQKPGTLPKRKLSLAHKTKYSVSTPDAWGPSSGAEPSLAHGSQEDRIAKVQAKKRETLLLANGHSNSDSLGRHKRRTSVDQNTSPSPSDDQPNTRVYLHHVQKGDTLAGLSIRFNCPQTTIQKANRLWPNDSIQLRSVAYIPVDSCGIRGRKVPTPKPSMDVIPDAGAYDVLSTPTQSDWTIPKTPTVSSTFTQSTAHSPALTFATSNDPETPYTHDSWVSIDHIPQPIEIARLSRRALGFFPPARRKSIGYTDTTPPRSPNLASLTHSPGARGRHLSPATRKRAASSASASAAYFLKQLRGPGGVGTLDSKTRSPGPPRDKLNEMFAAHLPNMAAPRSSFESVTSTSSAATGLSELGGRVEGWVRKMATKRGDRGNGEGDLIELVEGWDSGGPTSETGEYNATGIGEGNGKPGGSSARDDEERLLRERFPIRGRVFEEQSKR
ncbi:MAG: hypothetical protein MMC23_006211 [Stictis urceolatum]|nr:hypothetical protein [Stictis urceolata]